MAFDLNFAVKIPIVLIGFLCLLRLSAASEDSGYYHGSATPSKYDVSVIELKTGSRVRRQVNANSSVDTTTQAPSETGSTGQPASGNQGTTGSTVQSGTTENVVINDDDNHKYYTSVTTIPEPDILESVWVDLDEVKEHKTLSNSHRTAVTSSLSFQFRFYGHLVDNVTIATGGFLYMSPFIHKFLTATQYIAPLMANFDTRLGNKSDVLYKDYGSKFVVEWRDVHLQDQNTSKPFRFQTILHENGSIVFIYKRLPLPMKNISTTQHPVKVGLSDAFYIDTENFAKKKKGSRKRTIYEYHRVSVNFTRVIEGSMTVFHPLPTCNLATDCKTCINHKTNFECKWCGIINRCSDSVDWHRQAWLNGNCVKLNVSTIATCTTTTFPTTTQLQNLTGKPCQNLAGKENCHLIPTAPPPTESPKKLPSTTIGVVIVVVVIIVVLIGALGGWIYYAYSHPTSASGMWLMEHRPSQMKAKLASMRFWKKTGASGEKYAVESEA